MGLVGLGLAAACDPEGTDEPGRNGVQVRFSLPDAVEPDDDGEVDEDEDEVQDGALGISLLSLRIEEVLFEGGGPDGEVSTSSHKTAVVDVVTGAGVADVAVVDLVQGVYEPAAVSLFLAGDGVPSVHLVGHWDETAIDLIVEDALVLDAVTDRFVLPDGPDPIVSFGLHPEDWFDEVDIPELEEGQTLRIALDENRALYDAIVPQIALTTVGTFPEGATDE